MFFWQLPPFLLFGIYSAFLHPLLFRRRSEEDKWDEEVESEIVTRVKRRIEIKWGIYCILALLVWIAFIVGIVVLIVKTSHGDEKMKLALRWVAGPLRDTWRVYYS
jgi:hypothetical protein